MSVSGILNSGAVVFYHPLDNSTEHTLSQDWVGSAEYAPAKMTRGLFANIGNVVTVNNPSGVLSEGFLPIGLANTIKLNDTKFITIYPDTTSVVGVRIVNISGTTPIFGEEYLFNAPDVVGVYGMALSPSSVLFVHNSGDTPNDHPFIREVIINGDVITSGASLVLSDISDGTIHACALDSTRAFVSMGTATNGYVTIVELSGGVLASGNVETISDMRVGDGCIKLNSSGCVFSYKDDAVDGQVRVAAISGTTITEVGSTSEFAPSYQLSNNAGDYTNGGMCRLTDNKFMIFFAESNWGRLMAADVVGTNITLGSFVNTVAFYLFPQITRLTDDKAMVIFKDRNVSPYNSTARVASVDGLTVTLGSDYVFSDEDPGVTTLLGPINAIAGIDPASAFVFYTEHTAVERRVKVLTIDTSDTSLVGSTTGYPSMIGNTRVTACMWARNLTAPVSTVKIERGYSIEMTSGSIVLGGAATWDDGDITTLMDSLNDGESHFLVLDFENTGSDWALKTSVDGATWAVQGNQNTGSLSPIAADTSGQISITSPEHSQWIDEVVLWGGAKASLDIFTDNELFSLFSLASSGSTMAEYSAGEAPPPEATQVSDSFDLYILNVGEFAASGDLYIAGPLQKTGSVNLVIVGTGIVPDEVATLGRPLDWLLKTSDHNPQIIGTFATTVSGVNIAVWDVTNGENTAMLIPNSGCYEIGNTGRWGWSTINLPSSQGHGKHYYYQMTSNLSTTFDGQFLLDLPEGAKWIHPANTEDYIVDNGV